MSLEHLAKAARLTADMIECRDTMRRLFRDRYADRTALARRLLQAEAQRDGISVLQAGLAICKDLVDRGHEEYTGIIIAAMVDLVEEQSRATVS